MHIEATGTLTGYQAFTKKEDLLVYEKITFTVKEEGTPCIFNNFGKVPKADDSWSAKIPQDSACTILFDGLEVAGTLSEVAASCKACEDGPTTTYRFTLTRELNKDTVDSLIHPYFNAREESDAPKTQWSKGGPQMVAIVYPFVLDI